MYAQSLWDEWIKKILKQKFDEWVRTILYMWHIEKYPSNADDIEELENHGIKIETPKSPYIHAKAIFVDERIAYIGSINFTTNSIENNREVGVIIPLEK